MGLLKSIVDSLMITCPQPDLQGSHLWCTHQNSGARPTHHGSRRHQNAAMHTSHSHEIKNCSEQRTYSWEPSSELGSNNHLWITFVKSCTIGLKSQVSLPQIQSSQEKCNLTKEHGLHQKQEAKNLYPPTMPPPRLFISPLSLPTLSYNYL